MSHLIAPLHGKKLELLDWVDQTYVRCLVLEPLLMEILLGRFSAASALNTSISTSGDAAVPDARE